MEVCHIPDLKFGILFQKILSRVTQLLSSKRGIGNGFAHKMITKAFLAHVFYVCICKLLFVPLCVYVC